MTQDTNFIEMLCTRFCHDIIGPMGAVSNGAEFLREEMPNLQSQALDLIETSGKEAVARVQFYRQAYGLGNKGGSASLTEAKELSANFFTGSKIALIWEDKYTDMAPVNITEAEKKLILNLIIIISGTLIRGGKLSFAIDDSKFELKAEGKGAQLDAGIESVLSGSTSELSPKLVQAIYTQKLLEQANAKIAITKATDAITFTVTKG